MDKQTRSAELAARITAASAVLADYQHGVETADIMERAMWGARLADALEALLTALDGPVAGTAQPGGGWISGSMQP